jgi:formylglycine-generating enzyme required for sulfatase activity
MTNDQRPESLASPAWPHHTGLAPRGRWLLLATAVAVPTLLGLIGLALWLDSGKDTPTEDWKSTKPEIDFVRVPHGTFWMGGGGGKPGERQATIANDFDLGKYVVTQGQWKAVMGVDNNPSCFSRKQQTPISVVKDISDADLDQFPVETVSWNDCQEFIKRLNTLEKGNGWLFRLPTEAEWEYACRGASTSREESAFDFYFDKPTNDLSSEQANFNGNYPAGNGAKGNSLDCTCKVGSYKPNRLGLYDMHGNVGQWCEDRFYEGGPDRVSRVIRGGSWRHVGSDCRAGLRLGNHPDHRVPFLGVRLARLPSGGK